MFSHAYVRYLEDKRRAVVDTRDIRDSDKWDQQDMDEKRIKATTVWVKWVFEDGTSEYFPAEILHFGGKLNYFHNVHKSFCAVASAHQGSQPLTPWKVSVMRECFKERLVRLGLPVDILQNSLKRLNHFVVEKLADIEKLAKKCIN
ncbi:hypothetical protein MTO96_030614 [Rhipicephalus appendiculatus]